MSDIEYSISTVEPEDSHTQHEMKCCSLEDEMEEMLEKEDVEYVIDTTSECSNDFIAISWIDDNGKLNMRSFVTVSEY